MPTILRRASLILSVLLLTACAAYDGHGLQPGVATVEEVIAVMGPPSLRWQDSNGRQQLAFARGPAGLHTYMADFGADGRLLQIENVLASKHLARIQSGQTQEEVLRLIGPPNPYWTTYFEVRNELVWEWAICDDWSKLARFGVIFDAASGRVRSAYQRPETYGLNNSAPFCGR